MKIEETVIHRGQSLRKSPDSNNLTSIKNGFDSSEKNKQTNKQKQQLEWIQSGSAVYFKVRICRSDRNALLTERAQEGRVHVLGNQGRPGCRCFLNKGELYILGAKV